MSNRTKWCARSLHRHPRLGSSSCGGLAEFFFFWGGGVSLGNARRGVPAGRLGGLPLGLGFRVCQALGFRVGSGDSLRLRRCARRAAVRETWMRLAPAHNVVARFILTEEERTKAMETENALYNDMVFVRKGRCARFGAGLSFCLSVWTDAWVRAGGGAVGHHVCLSVCLSICLWGQGGAQT
jgi:hypothetical protein